MAIGYGEACPKPEARKRVKARRKRQAVKVVKSVRAVLVDEVCGRCERCGMFLGDFGHAHHRKPRSLGGKWTIENLAYYCARCHAVAHRLKVAKEVV